jgi:membrane associated rhomboid family serine protease
VTPGTKPGNIGGMARRFQGLEVIAIILLTIAVFVHEASLGPIQRILFDERYGAVPSTMWEAWRNFQEVGLRHDVWVAALPLITANYLHASVEHIGGNMLFFWVFANVLSQAVGRVLLLVIYVLAGMVAVLVYVHASPTSDAPMIGASGAIAGLEGAYFTLVFRWDLPEVRVWPLSGAVAPARLAFLAVLNFILDTGSFLGHSQERIAFGAHVGGFLGGALLAMIIATVWTPTWRDA